MMELFQQAENWVALGFVIFLVLAWKPAKGMILGGIDGRIATIKQQISEAEALRAEAEAALAAARQSQAHVEEEAEALLAQARAEIAQFRDQAINDMMRLTDIRRDEAAAKITYAQAVAMAEIRIAAADLVVEASRRFVASHAGGAIGDRLIEQSISGLPSRLN